MFRKQISPKTTAIAVVLILALVQFVYWRLLVYRPPAAGSVMGGGGGPGPTIPSVAGRRDIEVDTFIGEGPGYRDGGFWEARFCGPNALAVGPDGSIYVADSRNHRIRRISTNGQVSTVAGSGDPQGDGGRMDGAASAARFRYPSGVAVDRQGRLYISDTGNHRICRIQDGQVITVAGGVEGKSDGIGAAGRLRSPGALAVDNAGSVWVADLGNRAVRRLDQSGQLTTVPAPPPEISIALGQVAPAPATIINASPDGVGYAAATTFKLGHRSPGARLSTGTAIFADTEYGVLMVNEPGAAPLLAAGRRAESPPIKGSSNGTGQQCTFALPCATVLGTDGFVYVADYEANSIRKVKLPDWLQQGAPVPEGPQRGRRRMRSER